MPIRLSDMFLPEVACWRHVGELMVRDLEIPFYQWFDITRPKARASPSEDVEQLEAIQFHLAMPMTTESDITAIAPARIPAAGHRRLARCPEMKLGEGWFVRYEPRRGNRRLIYSVRIFKNLYSVMRAV